MQFPKQGLPSRLVSNGVLSLVTIAPLLLVCNAAQANGFYYQNHRYPEFYRQHRRSSPSIIFQVPLRQQTTESRTTTIFQNGQVIRIYEDQNSSGNTYSNYGGSYGLNQGFQRPSVEFSIGNPGEFRRIDRFPINPWHQPGWNRPIDRSSFRHGFPNKSYRRW